MNIGALQSLMGVGTQSPLGNTQQTQTGSQSFGAVFAGMTSTPAANEPSAVDGSLKVPVEIIQSIFNAQTPEELKQAILSLQEGEDIGLPIDLEVTGEMGSLADLSERLSINPEELLETIKNLLRESGESEEALADFSIATNIWTLLSMIDDAGMPFFDKLNESLDLRAAEGVHLLTFLKTIDMLAPKTDMVLSMEQKTASFQSMLTNAAEQFIDNTAANPNKQDILQLFHQKLDFKTVLEVNKTNPTNATVSPVKAELAVSQAETNSARIVLEANTSSSTNDNSAGQKQAETTTQVVNSANSTIPTVKAEFTISQAESNPANRSESLMKEMQTLFKRSNFGQVGGSTRMLIKLYPEHLGQIRIELHESNGVMTARILASTALAKGMLDSQLHQLKHAFNQQNLQVERIDITQSIQESSRNEREQTFNEQFKREQQENKQEKENTSDENISFDEYMIELEA